MRKLLFIIALLASSPASAQVWFPAVPNTIVNSASVDVNAQTEVNQNFASLISNGNTGQAALLAMIAGIGPIGIPSGAVTMWTGATCPTGYQTADGTNSTADARGVYIRGLDTGGSVDPGRTLASFQGDTFAQHTHGTAQILSAISNGSVGSTGSTPQIASIASADPFTITSGMISPAGGTETRPNTTVFLYCEKL